MRMIDPNHIPERGFYYHYKHDPSKGFNDHAYEVIGVGLETENRTYSVIYMPLYKNDFLAPAGYCVRPFEMFIGTVEKDGATIPRFQKIIDTKIISQLQKIRNDLYPTA